jgi:predicted ATP-grasp superfamily ATP-dependent carboligase
MELVERRTTQSVFAAHAAACVDGELPAGSASAFAQATADESRDPASVAGKAVVYARETATIGDARAWLDDRNVCDVPHPGERIERGQPICTVFAEGHDVESCRARLVAAAARIYADVARWQREAA